MSCDGWEISTVEHLGSTTDGLHPIQVSRATRRPAAAHST